MNLARSLERRLERLVEGLASKLFPGNVSAPELAQRLIREADLSLAEGPAGPVAPNVFGVRVHPDDLGAEQAPAELTGELAAVMADHATRNGWRLEGSIQVQVVTDPSMSSGALQVAASVVESELPTWAYLVIKSSGDERPISPNRCLVGRDPAADVQLAPEEVSRKHAIIWREGADVWIADLGSANGTAVNGTRVAAPIVLVDRDTIVFGPVETTFRMV
jgi:hypothetical protein